MIRVERTGVEGDAILRNLYQLYIHDMSEWLELAPQLDGRFAFDTASLWRGDTAVYLARVDGALAGFGVVQPATTWLGPGDARDVRDFFVLRRHRRQGVARTLARRLWDDHPGVWLVRVLAANRPAVPFWRAAVQGYRDGNHDEHPTVDRGHDWIHLRFDSSRG